MPVQLPESESDTQNGRRERQTGRHESAHHRCLPAADSPRTAAGRAH
jgi:hypothetical protein